MKKISYGCMVLVAILLFSACGNKTAGPKETVVKKEAKQTEAFQPEPTKISKQEEFSQDGFSVTCSGISYEDVVTKLNLHIKNDTEEQLHVTTANVAVNGLMYLGNMFLTVPAKSEADGYVSFSNSWLGEMQIAKIADVELVIKAHNQMNDEVLVSDVLEFKTDAKGYKQVYDDSGFEIYNDKNIKISARALRKSELSDDMELVFYAENNTNSAITVMSKDVLVNGIPMKPLFVLSVGAGKKAVDTMVFYDAELKEKNVTDIQTVTAVFKAFNENLETVFETEILKVPIGL